MAKQIISASTDTTSGLGYFLAKLWAKIKEIFYTKTETDGKLSGKQATITGGASTITTSNLTASRVLVANSAGKVAVSAVTSTELGYLDGVTSNVQTQLNAKASTTALADYLPLAGGTITGNVTIDNPCINIGGGYEVAHGSSAYRIIKFFSITLASSAWGQNAIYDFTYTTKAGCRSYGHLICRTRQGGTAGAVADAKIDLFNYDMVGAVTNFYYVRSSDTIVDFYYRDRDYANLKFLDVKCAGVASNPGNFTKLTVDALPDGYVQAKLIGINPGMTAGSGSTPIYISSGVVTACSTYAGGTKVTLNGTNKGASTASFYAPTTAGTSGYLLQSNGSGAPTWKSNTRATAAVSADTTPTDASVTMYQGTATCTLTLTNTLANAIGEGNDIVCFVKGATAYKLTVRYHLGVTASSYGSVVVQTGQCVRLVAVGGSWCLQV